VTDAQQGRLKAVRSPTMGAESLNLDD